MGGLDQLGQGPGRQPQLVRVVASLLSRGQRLVIAAQTVVEHRGGPGRVGQPRYVTVRRRVCRADGDQPGGLSFLSSPGCDQHSAIGYQRAARCLRDGLCLACRRRRQRGLTRGEEQGRRVLQCVRERRQRTRPPTQLDQPSRQGMPALVVPRHTGHPAGERQPAQRVGGWYRFVAEDVHGSPEHRRAHCVSVGNQRRQAIQQQVGSTRRSRTGHCPDGLGDLRHSAVHTRAPRGQRGTERLAVGLTGQPGIEWFQSLGRVEQERQPVGTLARADCQLGVQQVGLCPSELIQRSALRRGQQPPRRVQRTGLPIGLRRAERTASPPRRLGRKHGGAFAERCHRGQAAAGARLTGRAHELARDILVRL